MDNNLKKRINESFDKKFIDDLNSRIGKILRENDIITDIRKNEKEPLKYIPGKIIIEMLYEFLLKDKIFDKEYNKRFLKVFTI